MKRCSVGENILRNAPQEQCFRLANGRVLKNLHELANALVSMDERTFSHHVTPARNDFSNWIAGVFGEEELARQIRGLRSREEISRKLGEALKEAGKRYLAQKIERKRQEQKKVYAVQKAQKAPVQLSEVPHGEKKDAAEQPPARQEEEPARQSPAQKDAAIGEKLEALFRKVNEEKGGSSPGIEEGAKHLEWLKHHRFFSADFIYGFLAGLLLTVIGVLLYAKLIA